MKRIARLLALCCCAALALAAPFAASSAAAPTHRVRVGALPVGSHARIDYLTGRVLHTAGGRVVTIQVPRRFQDSLELLGRSPGGWVVAYHHASAVVEISHGGRARSITRYREDFPWASTLHLSTNGRLVAIQGTDEGDAAYLRVVDLAGRTVGRQTWTSGGQTLAFRGRTLYFSRWASRESHNPLLTWHIGRAPRRTTVRGAEVLDVAHDQVVRLLRVDPSYRAGVASVSQPDDVRWQVCETCRRQYFATAFSPDGKHLAGELGTKDVTVRTTADGQVVSDLAFTDRVVGERWEDGRHVLVEVARGRARAAEHALLRCGLDATCARVTQWQHHRLLPPRL